MEDLNRVKDDDPFLLQYQPSDLRTASEFLTIWLPFLTRDLCRRCSKTLSLRIRSLDSAIEGGVNVPVPSSSADDNGNCYDNNCDKSSTGSYSNSIGSWKDLVNVVTGSERSDSVPMETSTSGSGILGRAPVVSTMPHMSWADMALEDELEEEKEQQGELNKQGVDSSALIGELSVSKAAVEKPKLPRKQREYIRFTKVRRKKDFICLERFKGKHVNILEGLELHEGVFSAVEQKRIVDFVHDLQEKGKRSELKERTYTAPQKWMKGKGRVTIQFGCCYNYAVDKHGNPPGILQSESVDPIPSLFRVMIRRLVKWHVLPPSCVPDSCIVNIYDEGDCIPPHIDNHDFVRPFCTVSFLSECNILFGSNLKALGPGQFDGSVAIPLPLGSVLVLNGNGADIAKHCVPSVPKKRISITFRKMDERKRPVGFVPEHDLQGIEPLSYELDKIKKPDSLKSEPFIKRRPFGKEGKTEAVRFLEHATRFLEHDSQSEPHHSTQSRQGAPSKGRTNVDLSN